MAIQAAMDDAVATGLKWSDDTAVGPGYVLFCEYLFFFEEEVRGVKEGELMNGVAHVADNGSGIHGIEIYNRNLC